MQTPRTSHAPAAAGSGRGPSRDDSTTFVELGALVRYLDPAGPHAFRLDPRGRFGYLTLDAAQMLGVAPAELVGVVLWERYPQLVGTRFERACRQVLESRAGQVLECSLAQLQQWAEVAVSWQPEGLMVQVHDVSASIRARIQLRSSENLLQAVFDALPMWLSVKDAEFRYLMVNRQTLTDTGLSQADYHRTHTLDLPLGYRVEMAALLQYDLQVFEQGRPLITDDMVHTLADGSERILRHHKAPFHGPGGEIAGVVTISEDVTAQRQLVEDLDASRRSLQMAQELAQMGSWEWEPATGRVTWSEGLYALLRTAPTDTAPSYERLLTCIHPDDRELVVAALDAAISDGTAFDIEHRLLLDDRQVRIVRHRAALTAGAPGVDARILGTLLDVSDYKRVEQELRSNAARLARSNLDLEAFASAASHDLQEPLRKITAFGERLRSSMADAQSPERSEYLQRILESTQRMRVLIDDLLTYSRVNSRGQKFVETDLNAVVEQAREDLAGRVTELGAEVEVATLPTVWGDAHQLHQVFRELFSNALQFARPGVMPRVRVQAAMLPARLALGAMPAAPPLCSITVADNGIGFEQKFAERIFGVFKRLHGRSSPYHGTGIGLALCRKIVDRHGGHISAQSSPGEGTVITLHLALEPPNP